MRHPSKRLRDLQGLGPKSEALLHQAGIQKVQAFMQADPFALYHAIQSRTTGVSLNLLYAMIGAQENLSWQTVARERKTEILMRLDDMGLAP